MRATTLLSLLFGTVAATTGLVTACANGGDDSNYSGDDGGLGDATTGGDGSNVGDGAHGPDSGVACTPVGPSNDCTTPTSLGTLMPGQMMSATGNIATFGGQAYVAVSFAGNTTPAYHPQIALTQGGSEFAFDILSDCSGTTLTCGEGEASTGDTTWEQFYADADFASDAFVPIEPAGNDGGVVVRIYRRNGLPLSCNQYALTVSE